jgi:predicted nucleotidyltransferase component of viral defense system
MNLFDQLVDVALRNQPSLAPLRSVVEKELLHHDILRILKETDLLKNLTFIGGTCLRCCYGGIRLSEDLDFNGGRDFSRATLANMSKILIEKLQKKYGLSVKVSEPIKESGNVDTWKLSVETHPNKKDLPAQRINIDICALNSYETLPMLLLNPYGVDMGTSGLVIQAQSREEIFSDKLIAIALRPNRIKFRDLWDITWLYQQNVKPRFELIPIKIADRQLSTTSVLESFHSRKIQLHDNKAMFNDFKKEMQRFLPSQQLLDKNMVDLWKFILYLLDDMEKQMLLILSNTTDAR